MCIGLFKHELYNPKYKNSLDFQSLVNMGCKPKLRIFCFTSLLYRNGDDEFYEKMCSMTCTRFLNKIISL